VKPIKLPLTASVGGKMLRLAAFSISIGRSKLQIIYKGSYEEKFGDSMKVLLIHPPWAEAYGSYQSAAKLGNAYPPLGLCYLAAVLEQAGHDVEIIDAEMEGKTESDIVARARRFGPDLIGITSTTSIFHIAKQTAKALRGKMPNVTIVIGGPHCTAVLEESLADCLSADFAVYGESENTILLLIDLLMGGTAAEEIRGLIYRDRQGIIRRNLPPSLEEEVDRFPFPARKKLDLDQYLWSVPGKGIVRFTTIMTSRGCPFRCIFCSAHTVFGRKSRNRNIEKVLDELEQCVKEFDIRHFAFIDDTLTLVPRRVKQLCAGIIDRKLGITWEGWTRANTVTYDLLKTMRDAGFVRISFGIETADPQISKLVRKQVPLKAYRKAYDLAKKLGIETRGSVILGLPGETRETAIRTLRFARDLKGCDQLYLNVATPYPATELHEIAASGSHGMRLITDDFSEYKRYGNAVVEVNDLTANDLVNLQRRGFLMFYLTPSRIWYNFRRAGLLAFIKNSIAFLRSVISR
jgi:anaerobic magnesium-protoporphyrin IX monomethyl ester cyclase